MLNDLIKLADDLDKVGLYREASFVDKMITKVAGTGILPQEWSPSQSIIDNDFGGDAAKAFEYYHRMAVNQSQEINSLQTELSQLQSGDAGSVRQTEELIRRLVECEGGA